MKREIIRAAAGAPQGSAGSRVDNTAGPAPCLALLPQEAERGGVRAGLGQAQMLLSSQLCDLGQTALLFLHLGLPICQVGMCQDSPGESQPVTWPW